jgi:hypothetical protein
MTGYANRMTHSTYPYILVNGKVIADNWTDLVTNGTRVYVDILPDGTQFGGLGSVWSNTASNGNISTKPNGGLGSSDCYNWTNGTHNSGGRTGSVMSKGVGWSDGGVDYCDKKQGLFCFRQ